MTAAKIPPAVDDLFSGKAIAHLASVSAKGQPLVTPVWIDREGDRILVNSTQGRVKNRNMAPGAKVALSIIDPANPYRYVGVQGRVVEARGHEVADKHLDKLSQRYIGKPYPWRQPGDVRQLFVIEPTHVKVQA
jgi:PPOX class probable F420-dependent enzyme